MKRKTTFTLPAELEDKAQYLAKDSNDNTVRIALFYPGQLQPELMRLAVRQLVERIDILHAGFTAGMFRARWTVSKDFCPDDAFSLQRVKTGLMEAVRHAMLQPVPHDSNLQIHCTLILSDTDSAVVLNAGHMCADGGDTKYLLEKLIELYHVLLHHGNPDTVSLKNGRRDLKQCYGNLTKKERKGLYTSPASGPKTEYRFADTDSGDPRLLHITLPEALMTVVRKKVKSYNASVNDLLLAAFYRSVSRQLALPQGQPMGIQSMIDLRRHISGGQSLGVCNLSGPLPTQLSCGVHGSFSDTLRELAEQTRQSKADSMAGMYGFSLIRFLFRFLPFGIIRTLGAKLYGSASIGLTNLGALNPQKLAIDKTLPTRALFGGPMKKKPAFQLAAIGLGGTVTLCAATQCTDRDEQAIRELLEMIKEELEDFAKEA